MATRKNVRDLTTTEKQNFITAVKSLKADGTYDRFVTRHNDAGAHATPSNVDPLVRNAGHRGPAFLPWHRFFLQRFELLLQQRVADVTVPYWDWTQDAANPATSPIWADDFMGGNGDPNDPNNQYAVKTGPFAAGQWTIVDGNGQPAGSLQRQFGQNAGAIPTSDEVNNALGITPYDQPNWDTSSNPSYRDNLEGWIQCCHLHNLVHLWVGGSMLPLTSPNDPVFFIHHCNVDRLWAQWQDQNPNQGYQPTSGGPPGHNLNDLMFPWDGTTASTLRAKPADVLDYRSLGYTYA